MKQIKVLICILIISIGVIFQGEEYEPYLQNFSYEYPSLSIEYDEVQLAEDSIIDNLLKDAKKYNVKIFSSSVERKTNYNVGHYIFTSSDDIESVLSEQSKIVFGTYESVLSNDYFVEFKKFEDLKDIRKLYSIQIVGDDKDVEEFAEVEMTKYPFFEFVPASTGMADQKVEILFVWIIIGLVFLVSSIFDFSVMKKEFSVMVSYGESRSKYVVFNILVDIALTFGVYFAARLIFRHFTNCLFGSNIALICLLSTIVIDLLIWTSLFFIDIKSSIKGKSISKFTIVLGETVKVFALVLGIITITNSLTAIAQNISLVKQKDFFETYKTYDYVNINYNYYTNDNRNEIQDKLRFYRNTYSSGNVRIQARLNMSEEYIKHQPDILYFNGNTKDYLLNSFDEITENEIGDKVIYVLIPNKLKKAVSSSKLEVLEDMVAWQIDSSDKYIYDFEVIYYCEKVDLVAMSNLSKMGSVLSTNPIVFFNNAEMSTFGCDITGDVNVTLANDYIMYDLSGVNLDSELSKIDFNGKMDYVLKTNCFDDYLCKCNSIKGAIMVEGIESIVALLLVTYMSFIEIKFEMIDKAKEFSIKTAMGYSWVDKYRRNIIKSLLFSIVALLIGAVACLAINLSFKAVLLSTLVLLVMDYFCLFYYIYKIEIRNISQLIKGELI